MSNPKKGKEKLNGSVDLLANAFRSVIVEAMESTEQSMSKRFDGIDKRFDGIDKAIDTTNESIKTTNENMQAQFAKQEEKIADLVKRR